VRYFICALFLASLNYIAWKSSGGSIVSLKNAIMTMLTVLLEPMFFMGVMCLSNIFAKGRVNVIIRKMLGTIYLAVFLSECFYYGVSGEWISLLALNNMNQAYLLINIKYVGIIAMGVAIIVAYFIFIDKCSVHRGGAKVIGGVTLISFLMLLVISTSIHAYAGISAKKVTPVASFIRNIYFLYSNSFSVQNVDGYPFRKEKVYQSEIPFEKKTETMPNVIIVFTEGTSSRLIGAYNPKFHDVTPNIDAFAASSMRVDNYYNHTAATFRGTFGQLTSSYNLRGGYGQGGWDSTKNDLKKRQFQSLPRILNDTYTTVFFSPHVRSDAYTDLLETLNFQYIYTRDEIRADFLDYDCETFHESLKDVDMYNALISYLENYNNDKSLFVSMYTFDTHLGVELPDEVPQYEKDGETYESINSLHNLDTAFGKFWQWFIHSKYKDNTIVIFTADHAHYYDNDFVKLVKNDSDYTRCFIDRIPLIIYDPVHQLPEKIDANDRTSLDFAPTICHLLEMNKENSFLGKSLFENSSSNISVAAIGQEFYGIYNHKVYKSDEIDSRFKDEFDRSQDLINKFYMYESANKVFR